MGTALHVSETGLHQESATPGEEIKADMKGVGIKQEDVAKRVGAALGTVSESLRGIAATNEYLSDINFAVILLALDGAEKNIAVAKRGLKRRIA